MSFDKVSLQNLNEESLKFIYGPEDCTNWSVLAACKYEVGNATHKWMQQLTNPPVLDNFATTSLANWFPSNR